MSALLDTIKLKLLTYIPMYKRSECLHCSGLAAVASTEYNARSLEIHRNIPYWPNPYCNGYVVFT